MFNLQYTAQHVTQLSWKCCQYLWLILTLNDNLHLTKANKETVTFITQIKIVHNAIRFVCVCVCVCVVCGVCVCVCVCGWCVCVCGVCGWCVWVVCVCVFVCVGGMLFCLTVCEATELHASRYLMQTTYCWKDVTYLWSFEIFSFYGQSDHHTDTCVDIFMIFWVISWKCSGLSEMLNVVHLKTQNSIVLKSTHNSQKTCSSRHTQI